jgi:hypothetical protein
LETPKTLTETQVDRLVRRGGMWMMNTSSPMHFKLARTGFLWIPHPRIIYPGTFEGMWPKWRTVVVDRATKKILNLQGREKYDTKQALVRLSDDSLYLKYKPNQAFINHLRTQKYCAALMKYDPILYKLLSQTPQDARDETNLFRYIGGTYRNRKAITKEMSHAV